MLDFIWTLPVQLWGTRNKWTLQKILIHGRIRTTNSGTSYFPACTSNPSSTETVNDLILELLQYLLTLRHYKTLCRVQRYIEKMKIKELLTYSLVIDTI